MDGEINELEEYLLYSEFLKVANEALFGIADQDKCSNSVEIENISGVDSVDESDIDIMESILNMVEIKHALNDKFPEKQHKIEKRWGVHPLNQMRREQGHFDNLFKEMLLYDHDKFFNYTRMTPQRFDHLLKLVEPRITKEAPNAIPAKCRLLLTLRFLATGDSLKSLHFNFRLGISTAHNIIGETCEALWDILQPIYLKFPQKEDWSKIEEDFRKKLNFPHCVGALDGKLIEMFAPSRSGSMYFNYNKYFSTNLLAICDANKNFMYVDIGSFGQQTDGGILFNSTFGKRLDMGKLNFPKPDFLPHTSVPFPFFIIGDSAFPLKENLLTPYAAAQLSDCEANFNNEHSSVRKVIENTFAILVKRWQVLTGPIQMHETSVDKILKAATVLHNYIKSFDDPASLRYMREDRLTCSTSESLRSFYEAGLQLKTAKPSEQSNIARDTYANYLMNVL